MVDWLGDLGDPLGPLREAAPVLQHQPDDLAEAQRDDGQVVAPQPQHREAEQHAEERPQQAAQRQRDPEGNPVVQVQQHIGVSADRVEGHVAQVEQAGQADDDVQPQAEHHVDQGRDHDVGLVGRHEPREGCRADRQRRQDAAVERRAAAKPGHQRQVSIACGAAPGAPGHQESPQRRQAEGPQGHPEHVQPAPLDDPLDGVDLDHHDREGQEDEPEGHQRRPPRLPGDHARDPADPHSHAAHTFCVVERPRSPPGRKIRISTSRPKANTSS